MSKSSNRPHYVDEAIETVYVSVSNEPDEITAPAWVKQYFPGYKCSILTPANLKKKINSSYDV